jgi:hypothetical protein
MLGRRRQLATPASQGQTPGTAPGSQGRSGFPMATEGDHEFEDMSEVLVRGGPPGGPVIPGLPATPVPSGQRTPPPFPEAIEIDVEPWERRRRPRAPSSWRQTEEEVRPRATEAAPGRLPHQPEHPPSGRPRKPHAETPSFHLPVGLTPMQRAIIFAEILGKPGGRDPYF